MQRNVGTYSPFRGRVLFPAILSDSTTTTAAAAVGQVGEVSSPPQLLRAYGGSGGASSGITEGCFIRQPTQSAVPHFKTSCGPVNREATSSSISKQHTPLLGASACISKQLPLNLFRMAYGTRHSSTAATGRWQATNVDGTILHARELRHWQAPERYRPHGSRHFADEERVEAVAVQ